MTALKTRVVARATAFVQDPQERYLLTVHRRRDDNTQHYFFPGGKVQRPDGTDVAQIFDHLGPAGAFQEAIFNMKRETAQQAVLRELWEEFIKLGLVLDRRMNFYRQGKSPGRKRGRRALLTPTHTAEELRPFKIINTSGDGTGYSKEVDTETIVLPCLVCVHDEWMHQLLEYAEQGDRRLLFATQEEIRNVTSRDGRPISPDSPRYLQKLLAQLHTLSHSSEASV